MYAYGSISSSQSQQANRDANYSTPRDSDGDGDIDGDDEAYTTSAAGGLPQGNGALNYMDSDSDNGTMTVALSAPIVRVNVDVVLGVRALALVGAPPVSGGGRP